MISTQCRDCIKVTNGPLDAAAALVPCSPTAVICYWSVNSHPPLLCLFPGHVQGSEAKLNHEEPDAFTRNLFLVKEHIFSIF